MSRLTGFYQQTSCVGPGGRSDFLRLILEAELTVELSEALTPVAAHKAFS